MKHVLVIVTALLAAAVPARGADRLTDRDVKSLVEKVDQDRDHFVDALDDDFKHSVIRNATGEVDVKKVLEDFEKAIEQVKDRVKPEYSASTEVATLLRQATRIDALQRAQTSSKGASEWNALSGDLKTLAVNYAADFPLAEGAPVRRIGDHELAQAAEKLAGIAERTHKAFETDLKKDTSVDEATRKSLLDQVEGWKKNLETLHDRVKDEEPSSAEADKVLQGADAVKAAVESHNTPGAKALLNGGAASLQTLRQAYGRR